MVGLRTLIYNNLSVMLAAGLPILRSLLIATSDMKGSLPTAFRALAKGVSIGDGLAETMKFKNINKYQVFKVFLYIVRVSIGCMFIYGSLPKIRQPYDFLSSVYSYELVGPKLGMFVAMMLHWLEVLVGICLIGGIFISCALLVSIAMAAMFTYVLGSALYHGLDITCGCFGAGATDVITYTTLIRAIIILLVSSAAYLCAVLVPANKKQPNI